MRLVSALILITLLIGCRSDNGGNDRDDADRQPDDQQVDEPESDDQQPVDQAEEDGQQAEEPQGEEPPADDQQDADAQPEEQPADEPQPSDQPEPGEQPEERPVDDQEMPEQPGVVDEEGGYPLPKAWDSFAAMDLADPVETAVRTFTGVDPIAELLGTPSVCTIWLMGQAVDKEGRTYYFFRSTFNHRGETHPVLVVTRSENNPLLLVGKSLTEIDEMAVETRVVDDLDTMTAVRIKWFHRDHFDTFKCERINPAP